MRSIGFVVIAMLLHGCASTPSVTPQQISEKAAPVFGENFKLFYVPSRGVVMDAQFIAISKTTSKTAMAIRLASIISKSADSKLNIAVGGPNSAKSAVVIENAIELSAKGTLTHLHLVFVGNPQDSIGPENSVVSSGGKFTTVPYAL